MNSVVKVSALPTSVSSVRRRRLVSRDSPTLPYVWRGLIPTLGLAALTSYAVGPFARGEIEGTVQSAIHQAFVDQGLTDVTVRASGQQVLLTGSLKPGVSSDDALKLARETTCPTWLGPQVCAELVIGQFAELPSMPALPGLPGLPDVPKPSLDISVPSLGAAKEACDRALADAVGGRRIEFASGRAELLPASAAVLDAVTQALAGCKGVVRVEGHTDSLGSAELNTRLSEQRAQAVVKALVQRGSASDRLVAEGRGATQPMADNATREGRQLNRRIEFKMVAGQ